MKAPKSSTEQKMKPAIKMVGLGSALKSNKPADLSTLDIKPSIGKVE